MTKFDIVAVGAGALSPVWEFYGHLLSIDAPKRDASSPISTPWLWAVFWSPGQKRNFS